MTFFAVPFYIRVETPETRLGPALYKRGTWIGGNISRKYLKTQRFQPYALQNGLYKEHHKSHVRAPDPWFPIK